MTSSGNTSPAELPDDGSGTRLDSPVPVRRRAYDGLQTQVFSSAAELGQAAARDFAEAVGRALDEQDTTAVILASANSQIPFLRAVSRRRDIDWSRIHVLHMDEYLGMSGDHAASFRRFLRDNLFRDVTPRAFHELRGDAADPAEEIARYSALLEELNPSVCVLGIGENGHLAFNDPPADFDTDELVHQVELDEVCRRQQWGEGCFPTLEEVPERALSLTVPALLGAGRLICVVPERRKAWAVKSALEDPVSPDCPASVLRTVTHASLYLDTSSAALLS